jgi:hypothetical protein
MATWINRACSAHLANVSAMVAASRPETVGANRTSAYQVSVFDSHASRRVRLSTKWAIASGLFLVVLGIYILTNPGRIDIIDGQARFDVAYNWLLTGRPIMRDNLIGPIVGVRGRNGFLYSYYGAPGSIFAMPLVWLGLHASAPDIRPSQFLFSLTSSLFGAAIAPILFLFYLELGIETRRALFWSIVSSFATLIWPVSNSTFDNGQHAFFAIAALYFAFLSARHKSRTSAVIGGLLAGVLVLYQEYFLLIIPALALATLDWENADRESLLTKATGTPSLVTSLTPRLKRTFKALLNLTRTAQGRPEDARESCVGYWLFVAAACLGLALTIGYNDLRFGSWLDDGKLRSAALRHYPLLGNPLTGALTLLFSPGKSAFLYSPTLILGLFAIGRFWRRWSALAAAITVSSILLFIFLSCVALVSGDWCWGPRYLLPLLPLWALSFPFVVGNRRGRILTFAIIAVGLLVQLFALSVDNQRFFFERGFNDFFWAEDPWVYFKHSALLTRFGETLSLRHGVPPTAHLFSPVPTPSLYTYAPLGAPVGVPRSLAPIWIRNFAVFFLPRPWPLWMSSLSPALRPIDLRAWVLGTLITILTGFGLIFRGIRRQEDS